VKEGSTYRLAESNRRTLTLFTGGNRPYWPSTRPATWPVRHPRAQVTAADVAVNADHAGLKFFSDDFAPFVRSATYEEAYALNPARPRSWTRWPPTRAGSMTAAPRCSRVRPRRRPTMLRHALRACSYYSSKIGLEGTSRGFFSGKPTPDSKYSHLRGLFAYYALTGDERALAAGTAIADLWFNDLYFVGPYRAGHIRGVDKLWTERLLGTSLEGLYYGFRLTDNTAYLTAFKEVVTTAYRHITTTDQAELAAITKDPNSPPFPAQNCFIHNALQAAEGNRSSPGARAG